MNCFLYLNAGYCHIREGEEIEAEKVIWIGCRLVEEWVDNDSLSDVQFKLLSDAQLHQRLKLLLSKLFFVHGQLSSRLKYQNSKSMENQTEI